MVEIVFITSSREKLAHARYLAKDFDVFISKQKNYGIGYIEPRVNDRDELFNKSISDAYLRWTKNVSRPDDKLFFIEDTSVNIPSLAAQNEEYPGLEIKYWMKNNNFFSVNNQLIDAGNNRKAIVRSDVALVLSSDLEKKLGVKYKIFTSKIEGQIVDKERKVNTQPYFSWLSSKTFNKWFVPKGALNPLSTLPIQEADKYDFRAGSFMKMLNFLEEHGKIKRRNTVSTSIPVRFQPGLFKQQPVFLICGPSCAGKTTLAEFLVSKHNFYHFEASDFMYVRYFEHHGAGSDISIGDFATIALKINPTIVVDQIIQEIPSVRIYPIVITGFRSNKEVEGFKKKYGINEAIIELYIDANATIRHERSLIRSRGKKKSFEEFMSDGVQQEQMGLLSIKEDFINSIINEDSIANYYKSFLQKFGNLLESTESVSIAVPNRKSLKLEEAILIAFFLEADYDKFRTTTEIASLIDKQLPQSRKSKNNISRYFNQNFYPYFEILVKDRKRYYRLSQTGLSQAIFLNKTL